MDHVQSPFWTQSPSGHEEYDYGHEMTQFGDKKATNSTGLASQLVISITLGVLSLLAFCSLRRRWVVLFAPRTKLRRHTPPLLSSTFFGWIPQLMRIPEAEVLECVGLDAVMLLRFFAMSSKLFLLCSIPGLLIIFPVNYYSTKQGHDPTVPDDGDDDISPWTFTPKAQGASLLYLFTQFTFTWVFSILTIYTIWHTYEAYITVRRKYMLKRAKSITNRTVMVVGLPSHLQNEHALATFYEVLGAGEVESTLVVRHVRLLKRMVEQRAHALRKLEEAYTEYYGNPSSFPGYDSDKIMAENDRYLSNAHPTTTSEESDTAHSNESSSLLRPNTKKRDTERLGFLGLFGKKVDKIDHRREVFATLDKAVQKMRQSRIFATASIGFVTFEEMHSAQTLAQTVNTQETLTCETSLAPEPRDVYWDNLNLPPSELGVRSVVVNTTVFFLIFFWSGPIGIFSSFLNLDSLEKLIPGISKIAEANPLFKSVLQGFLPTLGVEIFLAVVPKITEALCIRQGIQSHSGIGRSIFSKYFAFILFNVVLVFTVVGTWAQSVNKVYHNLGELTLLLAVSLPRVAPFFLNYIILKGLGQFPLRLLQIGDVLEQTFRGIMSKTPRDYAEARAPPDLKLGEVYANATLAFVIVLLYSCMRPLILLFGSIFFALGHLVYKYQLLYVLFHAYESGGRVWPMVYNRIILGLVIFQLTMFGLFMLNQSYLLGALLSPLPIGTVWFWRWTSNRYHKSAEFMPLELLQPAILNAQLQPFNDDSAHSDSTPSTGSAGQANQVPGHVLIDVDQNTGSPIKPASNGNRNGVLKSSSAAVITPGGTLRHIPKSAVENDDYQALPDRYTDYRQPPMTLFPGVLNSGMRQYVQPAIAGPLPSLWLPLRKEPSGKDKRSRIGGRHSDSDSDGEDRPAHERVDAALARKPLVMPTRDSDSPQTFEQGDNLVGGGQDEDLSSPADGHENNASPNPSATLAALGSSSSNRMASRAPQRIPSEILANPGSSEQGGTSAGSDDPSTGTNEVYYHHPERQASQNSGQATDAAGTPTGTANVNRVRTVQGQGSRRSLVAQQPNAPSGGGQANTASAPVLSTLTDPSAQ